MPFTEMTVMIALFAALAVGFIQIIRLIQTVVVHKTLRKAVEKDPASAEPLLSRLGAPAEPRGNDDRLAMILVAVGVAMIGAALIAVDDRGLVRAALGASLFPLLVGGALWLRVYLSGRAARRASEQ